ncbi:23931_t:CDS:2, partial [Racocetra persica]
DGAQTDDKELYLNLWEDVYSSAIYLIMIEEISTSSNSNEPELFSTKIINRLDKLGQYQEIQHEIDTGNARPIKQLVYQLEDQADHLTEEIEVFHMIAEDYLDEKIEGKDENPLTNVEDTWDDMWTNREITLTAQIGYPLLSGSDNEIKMDINDKYLIDLSK